MSRPESLSPAESTAARSDASSATASGCAVCGVPLSGTRCGACGAAVRPGGYTVRRLIARTQHSRVYLARSLEGREVALKELLFAQVPGPQEVDAFEREARILEALSHPRIPRLLGHFQEGEGASLRLYVASEYIAGETLLERLSHHTFSEKEAQDIGRQVLELLVYLHGRTPRVLHRDIKPANIIRRPDGTLVLVDFGSARESARGATVGSTLVGTFGYMPLEQFGGTADATSDLYALGATLVHLLGRTPPADHFQPDQGLALSHLEAPALRPWLRKLTALRPADRYPSAVLARQALEALRPGGQPVQQGEVPLSAPSSEAPAALARLSREAQAARAAVSEVRGRQDRRVLDAAEKKALAQERRKARHEDDRLSFLDFWRMGSHWATTPTQFPVLGFLAGWGVYIVVSTFNLVKVPDLESLSGILLVLGLILTAYLVMGVPLAIKAMRWRSAFRRLPFALEGLGQVVHRGDEQWTRFTRCTLRLVFREQDLPPATVEMVKTARATALQIAVDRANKSISTIVSSPQFFEKLRWTTQGDKAEGMASWRVAEAILRFCVESLVPLQHELGLLQAVLIEPSDEQFKVPDRRGR
jgi:hypothetical protein